MAGALPAVGNAINAYSPLAALGTKYGEGTGLYLDSLGVNGPAGNTRATAAFQAGPGYDWAVNQGLKATERAGAGRGMFHSGNTLMALQDRGNQLANQEYGNWQTRLAGLVQPELTATGGAATGQAAGYGSLAGLYSQDALNRVNLGTTTTSGMAGANNQEAQARMQGSGNLWSLGLNLAKLGLSI